ncbi:MAG: amidase [Pseudomonadota bacterium]
MDDLLNMGALQLSDAMARGTVSAAEVMQATLARIEAVNGDVNAIVSLRDADALMAEAEAADTAPRGGWLHGIPLAVKDLANAKGLPTSFGSPALAGQVAQADDLHIARLRAAGAIVIGKTNTPEFGLGSHSFNPVHGTTTNPYAARLSAGGSSGGAGVALATRMTCIADGSDMMGSLRNPAAWNNVYGMRPSWGLVPSEPVGDVFLHQLATNGPMARSPRDLAALLDTIAGPDPRQPHGRQQAACLPQITAGLAGTRVGWLGDWGGAYPYEAGIMEASETALQTMRDLGATVEDVPPPMDAAALWEAWTTLRSWQVAAGLLPLYEASPDQLKDTAIWEIARGKGFSAMDVHRASLTRSQGFAAAAQLFETYDALVLPAVQLWPFDAAQPYPTEIAGRQMDTYHRWMEVVIFASLLGLPVVSIPAGFGGPQDTPFGLQLIGARGSDAKLLRIAEGWHVATDWPGHRRPQ